MPMVERDEPLDPEAHAMQTFGRRRARTRGVVGGILVFLGLAAGTAAYWWLRGWQLDRAGAHVPTATAAFTFGPALLAALALAQFLGRAVVRARAPRWIDELARQHGVARERLDEIARLALEL